ncbi:MAG: hypothetical protein CMJ31_11445 [Phycisphaerae bacterium]|nr:hypothetical protein [Phycisphaerae bacterium]
MNRIALLAGIAASTTAIAGPGLQITEAYIGLSGQDGTADWIEVTNFGPAPANLMGLFYDDSSADPTEGGDLPNIDLGAGESIVILIEAGASDIADFEAIWGTGINVIAVAGGGGLGQGGDAAVIIDAMSNIIDVVATPNVPDGEFGTVQFDIDGNGVFSTVGLNGAYLSAAFENDNFGTIQLIGNPGFIPAPAGFALLGLGGLTAARRRRA